MTTVDIGTRVVTLENVFFSISRDAVLIERKMLYYTILSNKTHHCTMGELKAHVFILSNLFDCLPIPCADQEQHSNRDFSLKFEKNTLQTCVNIAFEYPQRWNVSTGVINHLLRGLEQSKWTCFTVFLSAFVLCN